MRGKTDLQKKGRYKLMYQKAQKLGERTHKSKRKFGIEGNQGNLVTGHRQALRLWEKYIQYLYDSENHLKGIKTEEELDEDGKIPTILESEVVKPLNTYEERDIIPVDLLKELGTVDWK